MSDAEAKPEPAGEESVSAEPPELAEILAAFETEKLEPAAVSWFYQLGLVLVALMMFVLPLVYLALTAGVAWWSWTVFTMDSIEMQRRYGVDNDGLVFFSGFVGIIAVFFLVKPLFAKRAKPPAPLLLGPGEEPALEAFVNRIADAVGARRPRVIEVDCNVNAAAAFRRGLWSLFTSDLKLVIGLPLAGGMDLRSFGGVLAHEFGHFGQGTGMRLTYLIRTVNAWFARVVYERDAWDDRLASWSKGGDLRIMAFLMVTRLFIWLSRRLLWVLMHIGHGISCFAMRQMEYDADSYEVQFAGSEIFPETSRQLQLLNVGAGRAHHLLGEAWEHRQLARNMPRLGLAQARNLPDEVRRAIDDAAREGKTGIFDTHPSDTDRIAVARRLDQPGIFHLDAPASVLFRDFDALAEKATRHYYEVTLELPVTEENLVENDLIEGDDEARREAFESLEKFLCKGVSHANPIFLSPSDLRMAPDVTVADLERLRESLEQEAEMRAKTIEQFEKEEEQLDNVLRARELLKATFRINASEFGLPKGNLQAAEEAERESRDRIRMLREEMAEFNDLAKRRLVAGLEAHREVHKDSAEALRLAETIELLGEVYPVLDELRDLVVGQTILFHNLSSENTEGHIARMRANGSAMDLRVKKVRARLQGKSYPFPHPKGQLGLVDLIAHEPEPGADAVFNRYYAAEKCVNQLFPLYFRSLGRLAQLAEEGSRVFREEGEAATDPEV